MTVSHSSSDMLKIIRSRSTPALLIRMSRLPYVSIASCTIAFDCSQSATSPAWAMASPPAALISSTTASAGFADPDGAKSLTTTFTPCRPSSSACERPRPAPAPVTTATFPSMPSSTCRASLDRQTVERVAYVSRHGHHTSNRARHRRVSRDRQGDRGRSRSGRLRRRDHRAHRARGRGLRRLRLRRADRPGEPRHHRGSRRGAGRAGPVGPDGPPRPWVDPRRGPARHRRVGPHRRPRQQRHPHGPGQHAAVRGHDARDDRDEARGERRRPGGPDQGRAAAHGRARRRNGRERHLGGRGHRPAVTAGRRRMGPRRTRCRRVRSTGSRRT